MAEQQYMYDDAETQILSKFLLESKYLLDNVSHTLLGEVVVEEEEFDESLNKKVKVPVWRPLKKKIKVDGNDVEVELPPPINKKGYYATLTKLQPLLDKIACSGFITEEEANLYTRMNIDTLSELYVINFNDFEFRSISEMDAILDTILTLLKLQLSKSVNGELIKQLLTRHSINENLNQEKQEKKQMGLMI